jgi:hypothetical protein
MAIIKLSSAGLEAGFRAPRMVPDNAPTVSDPWVRPADWLTLPVLTAGQQRGVLLCAIYPESSNQVAISILGTAFTVDWGDGGAPENFAAGYPTIASHNTTWASISSGTLTSRGYRQSIVSVVPQGAGTFQQFDINVVPTGISAGVGHVTPWLDVSVVSSTLQSFYTGGSDAIAGMLEQFTFVGPSSITGATNIMFYYAYSLRSVVGTAWTSNTTDVSSMFFGCASLQTVPLFDLHSCLWFTSMFNGCSSLVSVPLFDTSAVNGFGSMFLNCRSLQTVPRFNMGTSNTDCSSMFSGCSSLVTVPLFDMHLVVSVVSMFLNCVSLQTVPQFNFNYCASFNTMFSGCSALRSVPAFSGSGGTNATATSMFLNCVSLVSIGLIDTHNIKTFTTMFSGCSSLQTIPLLNTSIGTAFGSMFLNCYSLKSIPLLDTHLGVTTAFVNMFSGCSSLTTIPLLNTGLGTSFASMFNNCVRLITVPLLDLSHGTTVASMFNGCFMLQTLPLFDTHLVTTFDSMLAYCHTLQELPLFSNAAVVTTYNSMFAYCNALKVGAMTTIKQNIDYSNCQLSGAQLDLIYTNLATVAKTIVVTGNWGTATDTPSIAQGKGWTVTG